METKTFPSWISDYIGIEYKDRGRDREDGLDCWGLVKLVQEEVYNRKIPSYLDYQSAENGESVEECIDQAKKDRFWNPIEAKQSREGDIILMQMMGRRCHVGIAIDFPVLLHIHRRTHSCLQNVERNLSTMTVIRGYRYER